VKFAADPSASATVHSIHPPPPRARVTVMQCIDQHLQQQIFIRLHRRPGHAWSDSYCLFA
jgi:hypothetical protein